jgi:hypothetical protein
LQAFEVGVDFGDDETFGGVDGFDECI